MNVIRHDFNFPARAGAEKERGSVVVDSADSLLLVWKNRAKVIGILAAKSWHVHANWYRDAQKSSACGGNLFADGLLLGDCCRFGIGNKAASDCRADNDAIRSTI